jgi:hypothetical protein
VSVTGIGEEINAGPKIRPHLQTGNNICPITYKIIRSSGLLKVSPKQFLKSGQGLRRVYKLSMTRNTSYILFLFLFG